jgi:hypothetical protein
MAYKEKYLKYKKKYLEIKNQYGGNNRITLDMLDKNIDISISTYNDIHQVFYELKKIDNNLHDLLYPQNNINQTDVLGQIKNAVFSIFDNKPKINIDVNKIKSDKQKVNNIITKFTSLINTINLINDTEKESIYKLYDDLDNEIKIKYEEFQKYKNEEIKQRTKLYNENKEKGVYNTSKIPGTDIRAHRRREEIKKQEEKDSLAKQGNDIKFNKEGIDVSQNLIKALKTNTIGELINNSLIHHNTKLTDLFINTINNSLQQLKGNIYTLDNIRLIIQ